MKFDPTKDSSATASQMLHVILIRELEAATSEEDLRARLRVALAPHIWVPAPRKTREGPKCVGCGTATEEHRESAWGAYWCCANCGLPCGTLTKLG